MTLQNEKALELYHEASADLEEALSMFGGEKDSVPWVEQIRKAPCTSWDYPKLVWSNLAWRVSASHLFYSHLFSDSLFLPSLPHSLCPFSPLSFISPLLHLYSLSVYSLQYLPTIQAGSSPLLHTHTFLLARLSHLLFELGRAWSVSELTINTLHCMARQIKQLKVGQSHDCHVMSCDVM